MRFGRAWSDGSLPVSPMSPVLRTPEEGKRRRRRADADIFEKMLLRILCNVQMACDRCSPPLLPDKNRESKPGIGPGIGVGAGTGTGLNRRVLKEGAELAQKKIPAPCLKS